MSHGIHIGIDSHEIGAFDAELCSHLLQSRPAQQ